MQEQNTPTEASLPLCLPKPYALPSLHLPLTPERLLCSSFCNFICKSPRLLINASQDRTHSFKSQYPTPKPGLSIFSHRDSDSSLPRIPVGQGSGPPPILLQPVLRCKSQAEDAPSEVESTCPAHKDSRSHTFPAALQNQNELWGLLIEYAAVWMAFLVTPSGSACCPLQRLLEAISPLQE